MLDERPGDESSFVRVLWGREFRDCEIGNENLHGLYNFTTKGDMFA